MLNSAVLCCLRGQMPESGGQMALPGGPLVEVVKVERPDAHMGAAVAFFGDDLRAVQLVWADGTGRRPWATDFCDGEAIQPVLGMRAGG